MKATAYVFENNCYVFGGSDKNYVEVFSLVENSISKMSFNNSTS